MFFLILGYYNLGELYIRIICKSFVYNYHMNKRGPGRPPRRMKLEVPIVGIVSEPKQNTICTTEYIYYDPLAIKSIFGIMKNLKVRDVYIEFEIDKINMYGRDHMNNIVHVHIKCDKALSYFCSEKSYISINMDNLDRLFPSINKNVNMICIVHDICDDFIKIQCMDPSISKMKERRISISKVDGDMDIVSFRNTIQRIV